MAPWLANPFHRTAHRAGQPLGERLRGIIQWKTRDELLDREIFCTPLEAKVLIERWREHYNRVRPHSSLGYRPPAPEAIAFEALATGCATLRRASLRPPPIVDTERVRLT